jgi:proteasome assembly chaperone (PAC2) family protein
MENQNIIWLSRPELVKPNMILAFTGWPNGGGVPNGIINYLIGQWQGEHFAQVKPDEFFIFQSQSAEVKRPVVNIGGGLIRSLHYMTTNIWHARDKNRRHDLIALAGPEPELNWTKYTRMIMDLAEEFHVEKIFALGGMFDAVPHTVSPVISAVATSQELLEECGRYGIVPVNYNGPTAIHAVLMSEAASRQIPMISLWAHTPHYVQVVDYIGIHAVLNKLNDILNLELDLEQALRDSAFLAAQIDIAMDKKPELKTLLATLEDEYRKGHARPEDAINLKIVKEIEEILKKE